MFFDIEFITTDIRSICCKHEQQLIPFLRPLHEENKVTSGCESPPYLRYIGKINTPESKKRLFFVAKSGIRFPDFVKHQIGVDKTNLVLVRKDQVRRFVSTGTYGVINRLKIGFYLELRKRIRNTPVLLPAGKTAYDKDDTHKMIKHLLNLNVRVENGRKEIPLGKLGDWFEETVREITIYKPKEKKNKEEKDTKEVKCAGINGIVSFYQNERITIPPTAKEFPVTVESGEKDTARIAAVEKCNKYLRIYYKDYCIDNSNYLARIYFIERRPDCPESYFHSVANTLINLRVHFLCLAQVTSQVKMLTSKQQDFASALTQEIYYIQKEECGFLNHPGKDCGEILPISQRDEINRVLDLYEKIKL